MVEEFLKIVARTLIWRFGKEVSRTLVDSIFEDKIVFNICPDCGWVLENPCEVCGSVCLRQEMDLKTYTKYLNR